MADRRPATTESQGLLGVTLLHARMFSHSHWNQYFCDACCWALTGCIEEEVSSEKVEQHHDEQRTDKRLRKGKRACNGQVKWVLDVCNRAMAYREHDARRDVEERRR